MPFISSEIRRKRMPNLKIQTLSKELCTLFGVDDSNVNAEKVSTVIAALVIEISNDNAQAYKNVVSRIASNDPMLIQNICDGIDNERNMLITNLSALR